MQKKAQKEYLRRLYFSFLAAASPERCLDKVKPFQNSGKILCVGIGKASLVYCKVLQNKINSHYEGIIVTNSLEDKKGISEKFKLFHASHPIPNKNGLEASRYLMDKVSILDSKDLLLCLVSGGGSSLLPFPPLGFQLEDEIALNRSLLNSGAPITVLNLIRKHFSRIKGGRLARLASPAKVRTLVVSDIPDDDIRQVASGPTLATPGTLSDAICAINDYKIIIPENIMRFFYEEKVDTPTPDDPYFVGNDQELLASASKSMKSIVKEIKATNVKVVVISNRSEGEARNVAVEHLEIIQDYFSNNSLSPGDKIIFLSGGETSVTITNPEGKGGRNGEYLLSLALGLETANFRSFVAIAADTDGIDGTEKNAGAIIDQDTLAKVREKNLMPEKLLRENNSYLAFEAAGDLFFTGTTGCNVNDFRAIIFNI